MEARERLDKIRKELSDGFDKYNRENDFDDPSWRRAVQNGLLVLKTDIKEDERRHRTNEEIANDFVLRYLRNAPEEVLEAIYSICAAKDYSLEAFKAGCRAGTVPDSILKIVVLALPTFIDDEKGENT